MADCIIAQCLFASDDSNFRLVVLHICSVVLVATDAGRYGACFSVNSSQPIRTPPPCILKPRRLWSGKQLIGVILSHVLLGMTPLNLESPSKVPPLPRTALENIPRYSR